VTEQKAEEILKEIFGYFDIDPKLTITPLAEDTLDINIEGDDLNFLIGRYGKALEALQTILSLMLFKQLNKWTKISLDINGYRTARIERLHDLVKKHVDRARFFASEVEMPPMSPWERREVHLFISDYDDIESESTGDGRDRRVVLKPKKK